MFFLRTMEEIIFNFQQVAFLETTFLLNFKAFYMIIDYSLFLALDILCNIYIPPTSTGAQGL